MTNSHLKAKIYMKQLSKIETIIYAIGGLMMALGTGLYVFFIKQDIACIVMLIGAIGFATIPNAATIPWNKTLLYAVCVELW